MYTDTYTICIGLSVISFKTNSCHNTRVQKFKTRKWFCLADLEICHMTKNIMLIHRNSFHINITETI